MASPLFDSGNTGPPLSPLHALWSLPGCGIKQICFDPSSSQRSDVVSIMMASWRTLGCFAGLNWVRPNPQTASGYPESLYDFWQSGIERDELNVSSSFKSAISFVIPISLGPKLKQIENTFFKSHHSKIWTNQITAKLDFSQESLMLILDFYIREMPTRQFFKPNL